MVKPVSSSSRKRSRLTPIISIILAISASSVLICHLKEDCQTLTGSFNKLESLREIKEELKKCTNKSEYDAKKGNYIRKCEESLRGLQEKSASSSMFGDDGKKLKANVKKQQELSNKFNFDPNKRIDDLIESIKQAIENNRGSGSGGSGSGRNRNKKNDNDGDDEDDN
ncbi:15994_t:CDS:2, partial [Entrophospora sp. SA101]